MPRLPKEIVTTLAKYTPCDTSDALVKFGIANGGYIPNLTIRSPAEVAKQTKTVVGRAYTVLYAPKSDPRPAVKESYIDNIPEGSVLVLGLPPAQQLTAAPYVTVNNALYGGLMSTRAHYRKAQGSVVLGRIRDLDEHNDLGYHVWSYGVGSTAPGPVVKVVGINVPIEIKVMATEGLEPEIITIQPEDYIIADKNGVVRLPLEKHQGDSKEAGVDLDAVLDYIPKRVGADTHVSEDIKQGKPAAEAQKFWRSKI